MLHLAVVIVKGTKNAIPNKVIHAEWTNLCSYVYCCFNLNIGLVNKSRNWNLIVTYVSWEVTPTATEFRCSHKFPYEMFAQFFLILLLVFFSKLATGRCTNKKYIARIPPSKAVSNCDWFLKLKFLKIFLLLNNNVVHLDHLNLFILSYHLIHINLEIFSYVTVSASTPQNRQIHSSNSSAFVDDLFACVWPFCGIGA